MNKSMKEWFDELLTDGQVRFAPILYYPGAQLVPWNVEETMRDGGAGNMARTMKALADRFPSMAIAMTGVDTSADAEAFGCEVMFDPDRPPHSSSVVVNCREDVEALTVPDPCSGRLAQQYETIRLAKEMITDRPVFGNLTAPFTTASMLMRLADAMVNVVKDPEMMHALIEKCTEHAINRALAFKKSGADGIFLNDATGGVIPPKMNASFSAPYIKRVVDAVQDDDFFVMVHNCGNIARSLKVIYGTGCRMYSFGNQLDMAKALETVPGDAVVLGNLDPMMLINASAGEILEASEAVLEKTAPFGHFILSSGCDCPPDAKLENFDVMAEAAAAFKA